MERLDRCKSMERRKPYSQTLSVENESTHKNHKTSLRLRKCNSSVGSAATFPFRARSRPAYGPGNGGADIFLDHSGSTYIIPKLSLYSTGLMPPKVILIRSSLYQ